MARIRRAKDFMAKKQTGATFIPEIWVGNIERTTILEESDSSEFGAGIVIFPPGTRNKFHVHNHEQILYSIDGRGVVATDKEEIVVEKGDLVLVSAGEKHYHGATKNDTWVQLYVHRKNGEMKILEQ